MLTNGKKKEKLMKNIYLTLQIINIKTSSPQKHSSDQEFGMINCQIMVFLNKF